jgi:pectate lyase
LFVEPNIDVCNQKSKVRNAFEILLNKCIKVVGNKHILSSYTQHGMKGIKIVIAQQVNIMNRYLNIKRKAAVPLHAMVALGGRGGIASNYS